MNTLYLLSVGAQKDLIKQYCFSETCGKILIGHVIFMDASWLPCDQPICPIEEQHWDAGEAEMEFGGHTLTRRIIVRKLKEDNT
jgi:hypothetical protein